MGSLNKSVVGTCIAFCPPSEASMRKREGLLHRLEQGPKLVPIKEYTRSAAGLTNEDLSSIRPPHVLQETVAYLFNNIASEEQSLDAYEFLCNRFKSVKQDLFKQQCHAAVALPILEPIVRYFAWAAYWYCEDQRFEKHLHDLLLLECLKECLRLSEEDKHPVSSDVEALYVLYDLGQNHGLHHALSFLGMDTKSNLIRQCLQLSIQWYHGHFTMTCKIIKNLPPLLMAFVCTKHLGAIQRQGLRVMASSYSCRNMVTPWKALKDTEMFDSPEDAKNACSYYGISVQENGVIFRKSDFDFSKAVRDFKKPQWIQKNLDFIFLLDMFYEPVY